jgi:hypothetical protein
MLPGLAGIAGASVRGKTVTYLSLNASDVNGTSYTVSGASFGAAASDRYIVIVVTTQSVSGAITVSSATIGGVSATSVTSQAANPAAAHMWIAAVPTGTTGDIVVNFSVSSDHHTVAVWSITGLTSTTPIDTDGNTVNPPTAVTLTSVAGGVVIGAVWSADAVTVSWSGATEDYDSTYVADRQVSGASGATTGTSVVLTPTVTGGSDAMLFVAATF